MLTKGDIFDSLQFQPKPVDSRIELIAQCDDHNIVSCFLLNSIKRSRK